MAVRNLLLIFVIWLVAAFMALAPWSFGIQGPLLIWYLILLAIPYGIIQTLAIYRIGVAKQRGRRVGRAVYVALALSWACAIGFGFTVPEQLASGELLSVLGKLGGEFANEMAIALCNPLGIIAMVTAVAALIFAASAGRPPASE